MQEAGDVVGGDEQGPRRRGEQCWQPEDGEVLGTHAEVGEEQGLWRDEQLRQRKEGVVLETQAEEEALEVEKYADESLYSTRDYSFCGGSTGTTTVRLRSIEKEDYYGTKINLTGTSTWFAASAFSKWSCGEDAASLFGGRAILELGSGTGLSGIALSKCLMRVGSPSSLLLTDGEEEVVALLRSNIALNSQDASIDCQQLWWGPSARLDKLVIEHPSGFEIVFGCDLFYSQSQSSSGAISGVFIVVEALLSRVVGSSFYLSFTRRDLDINVVLSIAKTAGFVATVEEDCCYDIYGTWTSGQTDFWRDAVYRFQRIAQ